MLEIERRCFRLHRPKEAPRVRARIPVSGPSTRQREVVQLLAEGRPMKEVAYILGVTTRTVAFHKYQVMGERGLKSTASLVQFAIKNRILVQ